MYTRRLTCTKNVPDDITKKINENYIKAGEWDSKDDVVVEFKKIMKRELKQLQQGKCAYCELPLETRNPEIEHIAPKGGVKRPKYVECMFLPMNLVYACHHCNSPQCKGQKDTVVSKNGSDDYTKWSFSIVHPYLDDPLDFFEMVVLDDGTPGAFPIPKHDADSYHKEKALNTIKMFQLDGEKCMELAKERLAQKYKEEINNMIKTVSSYRPAVFTVNT